MRLQNCLGVLFDADSISHYYESESVCLFYCQDENVFMDEDGNLVWDIFTYVTPNDVYLLHEHKEYMVVRHRSKPGVICELHYPLEEEYYSRDSCTDYS